MLKLLALLLGIAAAHAQTGSPVKQSGNVTPGHAMMWVSPGVAADAGTAAYGFLTSLGVTAQGPGICQNSAPITQAYNQICLTASSTGGGFSFNSYGGASGIPTFKINGTTYQFPFTTGGILGPPTTVVGDIATWNNTTGTLLADSGAKFPVNGGTLGQVPYYAANGQVLTASSAAPFNVKFYGATGNGQLSNNTITISNGSPALAVGTAVFVSTDCQTGSGCTGTGGNKLISVPACGNAGGTTDLITTITSFTDSEHVGLAANCANTAGLSAVTGTIFWGNDDTSAISAAIAAIPAGNGSLYFPAGRYLTPTCNFTLSDVSLIFGDGRPSPDFTFGGSSIICLSPSATLFTVTSHGGTFRDIGLLNPSTTPTTSAGIKVLTSTAGSGASFDYVAIAGFNINIDIETASYFTLTGSFIVGFAEYGIRIENIVFADAGGWVIGNNVFSTNEVSIGGAATAGTYRTGVAAMINLSAGGGKFIGNEVVDGEGAYPLNYGIILNGVSSSQLNVVGNEFDAIGIPIYLLNPWGTFGEIAITGNVMNASAGGVQFTGSISGTTLTVTVLTNTQFSRIVPGSPITPISGLSANTVITAQLTNTDPNGIPGGLGTYSVSPSQTLSSSAMTTAFTNISVGNNLTTFGITNNLFDNGFPMTFVDGITVANGIIGPNPAKQMPTWTSGLNGLNNVIDYSAFAPPVQGIVSTLDPNAMGLTAIALSNAAYGTIGANGAVMKYFQVSQPTSLVGAYVDFGTCSGNIDIGIYNASTGAKITTAGSTACPGTGVQSVGFAGGVVTLYPGNMYYGSIAADNTTATILSSVGNGTGAGFEFGAPFCNAAVATSFPLPTTLLPSCTVNEVTGAPLIVFHD